MARSKGQRFATPFGVSIWTHLQIPQLFDNKERFTGDKGKLSVDLRLDPSDPKVSAFIEKVDAYCESLIGPWKDENDKPNYKQIPDMDDWLPTKDELDEDGEPTGMIILKASCNAGGIIKNGKRKGQEWSHAIPIVDAGRKPLKLTETNDDGEEVDLILGRGSRMRIEIEPSLFDAKGTKYIRARFELISAQVSSPEFYSNVGTSTFDDEVDEMTEFESVAEGAAEDI